MGVAETFHELVGGLEYPMFIVTARAGAEPLGDAGDHDLFLLDPIAAEKGTSEDEFTFHRAKRIAPGHDA